MRNLLSRPDVRLVTLVGPPGIGKTRLTLAVAEAAMDDFAEGVAFVPLAPLRDPGLVVSAIAQPIGVLELGGRPLLDTLVAALSRRQFLLVLDNFEHLLEAASVVAELLAACPGVKVLATSRAPLRVYGEHEAPVPPLGLPDPRRRQPPRALADFPAVGLFVERARAVRPDFALTADNAATVAEVCRRLDGMPLAIELAAARVKLLAPEVILARLDRRLELLTAGARDAPDRHQTLRAAVDWSHDLLSEPEQVLLRRLAVFVGGWTLEAAEGVCAGQGIQSGEILELLAQLVDRSLVQVEEHGGEVRYRLLETIREYASDRLEASGELVASWRRHAEYYLALAEQAEPELSGPNQAAWLDRLEAEHDNLRAALRWMNSDGQADVALKVSTALWRFWYVRGHLSEGREWLTELVALAGPSDRSALRASALNGLGTIALRQGDHTVARSLYEETLAICRQLGDQAGIALGLGNLGNVAHDEGDNVAARSLHEDGLIISRQLGDQAGIALGLGNLGNVLHDQGDLETARLLHQERLALARELGDQRGIAYSIADLGDLARDQGDPETARLLAEESLGICQQLGDLRGIAYALESLAKVALATARTTHAVLLFGAAGLLREAIGAPLAPKEHGDLQAALVASRVALGDLAFEAAWAEVQSMALQQAVEYALASDEPTTTGAVPQEDAAGSRRPGLLTAREREVAVLIARGLTNRQIAEALVISERTADTHVGNILGKLGLATRAQVAAWAVEHKLLETRSG